MAAGLRAAAAVRFGVLGGFVGAGAAKLDTAYPRRNSWPVQTAREVFITSSDAGSQGIEQELSAEKHKREKGGKKSEIIALGPDQKQGIDRGGLVIRRLIRQLERYRLLRGNGRVKQLRFQRLVHQPSIESGIEPKQEIEIQHCGKQQGAHQQVQQHSGAIFSFHSRSQTAVNATKHSHRH